MELGLRPEETQIMRRVGVSRGDRVVLAREGKHFFVTDDGRRVDGEDVKNRKWESFTADDTAAIVLPPGRRLHFAVHIRRR